MWLRMRLGRPVVLSQEDVARASKNLLNLRWWAVFAVEETVGTPGELVARFEQTEHGSQSVFVCEELQFARGCLAFVRGDAKTARRLIEPLAKHRNSNRFHVLARLYDAHSMWPEAAARYEAVVNTPNLMAVAWPALWNLDRFRLAQIYERLGDAARARSLYEGLRYRVGRRRPGHPRTGDCSPAAGSPQQTVKGQLVTSDAYLGSVRLESQRFRLGN